jgi:hypothetical protein
MAKKRRVKISEGGPYVAVAVICERVLLDKDGVASLIRMIDRVTVTAHGAEAPEEMPPINLTNNTLFISLKSGFVRGNFRVKIRPIAPSGTVLPELGMPVLLEGEERGVNIQAQLHMQLSEEGIYWFEVRFEDQLLTRVPLRLLYQRMQLQG